MADEQNIKKILFDFMNNASEAEIHELRGLLASRKGRGGGGIGSIESAGLAGKMAADINKQMGFTQENVRRTAVDLVVKLARQKQPNITPAELNALVNEMVPGAAPPVSKLPPDVMKSMVMNYVLFRKGRLSTQELKGLPNGWQQKFWDAFPVSIKREINEFLNGRQDAESFWHAIERNIKK